MYNFDLICDNLLQTLLSIPCFAVFDSKVRLFQKSAISRE